VPKAQPRKPAQEKDKEEKADSGDDVEKPEPKGGRKSLVGDRITR
jgi:hypothetical protein